MPIIYKTGESLIQCYSSAKDGTYMPTFPNI